MKPAALSRRDFLTGMFRRRPATGARVPLVVRMEGAVAPAAAPATSPRRFSRRTPLPILRPPGAILEREFLTVCTRCTDCFAACPHGALTRVPARLPAAADTPMIDPRHAACHMCPDMPCIAACPTGALRFDASRKMGTAVIKELACLAFHQSPCSVCAERCPVPGALTLVESRPVVTPDICTGCGMCQFVCPAPENAVVILARKP